MLGRFKKKDNKQVESCNQKESDRRTFLINGEWIHVPNCVDETPWAEANESENNPLRDGKETK